MRGSAKVEYFRDGWMAQAMSGWGSWVCAGFVGAFVLLREVKSRQAEACSTGEQRKTGRTIEPRRGTTLEQDRRNRLRNLDELARMN